MRDHSGASALFVARMLNQPRVDHSLRAICANGAHCAAAGISRPTFYAHYDGLRCYLTTPYANMLEGMAARSALEPDGADRPLAVAQILEHVEASGAYGWAVIASTHRPAMIAAGEEMNAGRFGLAQG